MFQRTKVCTGVLVAMGVLASSAYAQTTERVEVTGSRIKSIGATSTSPITSVGAEEINSTQPMAVEEVIRGLPASIPAIGPNTNNGSGGGATIDLRGLGTNRTLVLINGRRFVPFNLAGVVDTNSIPLSLLERIDVFTGGASAVYGADAVAGVVNFVLRKNFSGVEASTSYGVSEEGDAKRTRSDLTLGATFADGKGNVALSVGKTKTDPLIQGQRPYSLVSITSTTLTPGGSGTTVPSAFTIAAPSELTAAQWSARTAAQNMGSGANQINPATGALGSSVNLYNFNPPNYFITPLERNQFSALGSYRVNDMAEAYAELFYTRSDVQLNLASTGTFNNTYTVPIGNPYMPAAMRNQICAAYAGTSRAITNCAVGSTETVSMQINRRITENGPRINDFQNNTFQYTVGLRGSLPFFSNWGYDGYLSNGKADQLSSRVSWGSLARSRQALDAVSTTTCRTNTNGCVPLNVWGAEGSITPAQLAFFNVSALQTQKVIQTVKALTVSGDLGPVMSPMAKEPISLALGVERRITFGSNSSDGPSQIQGEVLGTGAPLPDRKGDLKLDEANVEMRIPLVTGKPFADVLALDMGYRQTKFKSGTSSQDYGSWKAGGEYAPFRGLRFRAMQQRATRAPNVNELYQPVVTGLSVLATDPCAGAGPVGNAALTALCVATGVPANLIGGVPQPSAGQINVLAGGNPNLEPEEADTTTIGFVFEPSFAKSLSLSLDYYKITIEKAVSNATAAQVNAGCYLTNPSYTFNTLCALIRRSPVDGTLNGGSAPGIVTSQSNLGTIWTEGWDLGVNYRLPFKDIGLPASLGRLDISLNLNLASKWEIQTIPGVPILDCLGYYGNSCGGPTYKNKFTQRTVWNMGDWQFQYTWRHVDKASEEPGGTSYPASVSSIKAYDYVDAAVDYNVTKNVRLRLSVTNLFDKQPPEVGSTIGTTATNSGNTFPAWYDVTGRAFTVGATIKF